jgi:hypothetical protein
MDTASPAVSPSVVAAILISQKMSVTSGTLLRACSLGLVILSSALVKFGFDYGELRGF